MFWFFLHLLSEIFLILRRTERDVVKMYIGVHVKYPLFLSDFNATWIFSTDFSKNTQISNFMKILPVGAELLHEDWRTDMKLIVAFSNFDKAHENCFFHHHRTLHKQHVRVALVVTASSVRVTHSSKAIIVWTYIVYLQMQHAVFKMLWSLYFL